MPGGSNDNGFVVLGAKLDNPGVAACKLKSTTTSPPAMHGAQIVALVNLAGDFEFAKVFRARNQRLAHAAL